MKEQNGTVFVLSCFSCSLYSVLLYVFFMCVDIYITIIVKKSGRLVSKFYSIVIVKCKLASPLLLDRTKRTTIIYVTWSHLHIENWKI